VGATPPSCADVAPDLSIPRYTEVFEHPGADFQRVVQRFYVSDVHALSRAALAQGLEPSFPPRDASWGERYFHITGPDGHELSFAKPAESTR